MIEILQRLFIGHAHKWDIIRHGDITQNGSNVGHYYDLRCLHCGKVKRKNLES